MREEEVIKLIGKKNLKAFFNFMRGKTIGINSDGSFDYYDCDVKQFVKGR